jgi:glycosyltransferase involved in cell wall biosynthesis
MKILYLLDFPLNYIGGASKSAYTTAEIVKQNGHSVIFVEAHNKLSKTIYLIIAAWKNKPDIIHAQFSQYGLILILCKYLKLLPKKSKCLFQDRYFFDGYNNLYKNIFRLYSHKLYAVICTTESNMNRWKEECIKTKIELLPNVLNEKWYEFDANRKSTDKFTVGFAARWGVPFKRWDTVVDICNLLKDKDINIYIALAKTKYEKNIYKEMQKFVENLGLLLKNKLKIIINANETEMEQFFYDLDVFVLTSVNESFGRTLIEAMSKGCTVLGTNSGGVPNVIGKYENLFEVADAQTATNKILEFYDNPIFLEKDKVYFLNRVCKEFSIKNYKKKLLSIYEV